MTLIKLVQLYAQVLVRFLTICSSSKIHMFIHPVFPIRSETFIFLFCIYISFGLLLLAAMQRKVLSYFLWFYNCLDYFISFAIFEICLFVFIFCLVCPCWLSSTGNHFYLFAPRKTSSSSKYVHLWSQTFTFLATLVALHFTHVSEWVSER